MASNGATLRQRSEALLKAEKYLKKVKRSPKASEDEKKYVANQKTAAEDSLNNIIDSIKVEEVLILNTVEEVKAFIGLHSTSFADGKRGLLKKVERGSVGSNDTKRKMRAILESVGFKAFLVGKDFGALPAYLVAAVKPERVCRVITLGIPFMLPGPSILPSHLLPKGFYILRWQEPGRAEADFGRLDVKMVIRNIYILFSRSELPVAGDDREIMDLVNGSTPLPPWFSEEDLAAYASLYEKSEFRFALRVPYREYAIVDPKITAPALLIMGEKDYVLKFPGMEDNIRTGQVKHFVPNLDITFMLEGWLTS